MSKLTIIIPTYNSQNTIRKTLDSVVNQLNKDVDLLVVDDGSTDGTEKIINEYIKNFESKITYYKKENAGVADTRNYGISNAKGKYILFLDSDDYIKKGLIKELQKYIKEDIDIVKFKLERVNISGTVLEKVDGPVFEKKDGQTAFNMLCFKDVLLDSPCVYMFKKELFTLNNLEFKVNTEHEDFGLIPLIILKAKSVVSLDNYAYCYLQTQGSITRTQDYSKTLRKFNDALLHYDAMIDYIKKEDLSNKTKRNIKTYYTNAIILKLKEIKPQDINIYIQKIKDRKMIKNIQVNNLKQLVKKVILNLNIKWYLKLK